MPAKRNGPESYDAKLNKPAPKKQGILKVGALMATEVDTSVAKAAPGSFSRHRTGMLPWILAAAIGAAIVFRIRAGRRA